jgi:hypothetical protein
MFVGLILLGIGTSGDTVKLPRRVSFHGVS